MIHFIEGKEYLGWIRRKRKYNQETLSCSLEKYNFIMVVGEEEFLIELNLPSLYLLIHG